jgi:hypothetical protein
MRIKRTIKYIPETGDKVIVSTEGVKLECLIESITPHWINVLNPRTNTVDYCPDHGMLDWDRDQKCWTLDSLYC